MKFSLAPLHILLVEDNPFTRKLVKRLLRGIGIASISEASDGSSALEQVSSADRAFDMIFVDWEMAPMDGLAFIRAIRSPSSPAPYIPVIMLTAHTDIARVSLARDSGATEILTKPVSALALYTHILSTIEKPRPFIKAKEYFGPDRRRRSSHRYVGPQRRQPAEMPA